MGTRKQNRASPYKYIRFFFCIFFNYPTSKSTLIKTNVVMWFSHGEEGCFFKKKII